MSDRDDERKPRSHDPSETPTISGGGLTSVPQIASAGLVPGSRLGPYQLGERLGAGGMGEVFEALEVESGRRLAVKVLGAALRADDHRQRFFREGRLAASISHPNSVYVFGTDEIGGRPVIAMELVSRGSLRDRVASTGPMALSDAIEATLQASAGLEAAHAVGVLHRDIKPSNLFVDSSGQVKVGDFGLSISTHVDSESQQLTQVGAFVGTPSYSSPEQLRGGEMDVRSDIYALGASLFYLLTGKPPFEALNPLQLVAAVVQDPAPLVSKFRNDLPRRVDAIVQRCLAKNPADRFPDYEALRVALRDLLAISDAPANPGLRLVAWLVDSIPLMVLFLVLNWRGWGDAYGLLTSSLAIAYYASFESLLKATPGKLLVGLRVRRGQAGPGWRAWIRAAMFVLIPGLPLYTANFVLGSDNLMAFMARGPGQIIAYSQYAILAALFVTARRRNGFAGLHDLASGTRVVSTAREDSRRKLAWANAVVGSTGSGERIGPYELLDEASPLGDPTLCVGHDERLDRKVWIRRGGDGSVPVDAARRSLDRPGRLRWLSGRDEPGGRWDAFEAPDGAPLSERILEGCSWSEVRFWLLDLANELAAAHRDDSVAPSMLDVKRVWITRDGRARFIDFAGGEVDPPRPMSEFLLEVARTALEATPGNVGGVRVPEVPLPLTARRFLEQLAAGQLDDPDAVVARLRGLVDGPGALHRKKRFAQVAAILTLIALPVAGIFAMGSILSGLQPIFVRIGGLTAHGTALEEVQRLEFSPSMTRQRLALETLIAGRLRDTDRRLQAGLGDPIPQLWEAIWTQQALAGLQPETVQRMRELWSREPVPTEPELQAALAALDPKRRRGLEARILRGIEMPRTFRPVLMVVGLVVLSALLLLVPIGALLFRGGASLSLFGIAVVDRSGLRVGRIRALARALVAIAVPLGVGVGGAVVAIRALGTGKPVMTAVVLVVCAALAVSTLLSTLWNPRRALHDRIVGTHLVPR